MKRTARAGRPQSGGDGAAIGHSIRHEETRLRNQRHSDSPPSPFSLSGAPDKRILLFRYASRRGVFISPLLFEQSSEMEGEGLLTLQFFFFFFFFSRICVRAAR